jgi:hypothetical protein
VSGENLPRPFDGFDIERGNCIFLDSQARGRRTDFLPAASFVIAHEIENVTQLARFPQQRAVLGQQGCKIARTIQKRAASGSESLSIPNRNMLSMVEAEAKSGAVPSQRFSGPERKSSS